MSYNFSRDKNVIERSQAEGVVLALNPNPVICLVRPNGQGASWEYGAFTLKDGRNYYYFSSGNPPHEEIPPYLRLDDVVPSGTYVATYPADVRSQIMEDLGINEEQFRYFIYVQDSRVTKRAVLVDLPFNKAINRVDINGGFAQRYNYNNQDWEENGDGLYEAPKLQRLVNKFRSGIKNASSHRTNPKQKQLS